MKKSKMTTQDVQGLAEALETNDALEFISVENNSYKKEGALRLLQSLKKNNSVIYLNLDLCKSEDMEIYEAIKFSNTLIGIRSLQTRELVFGVNKSLMYVLENNRSHFVEEVKLCLFRQIHEVGDFEVGCVKIILEMANWKNVSIPVHTSITPRPTLNHSVNLNKRSPNLYVLQVPTDLILVILSVLMYYFLSR
jgi:hypothetical protein